MIYFTDSIKSLILRLCCVTTALLLVGCTKSRTIHHMIGIEEESNLIHSSPEDGRSTSSSSLEDLTPTLPSFAIVLLHGLNNNHNELASSEKNEPGGIAKALDEYFGERVLIIQPKSRNGIKSLRYSVAKQAKYLVKEIKTELSTSDVDPTTFPIVLIGYSQGGVVGCELARKNKGSLHIKLVITMNAPLNGTPILDATVGDIRRCMKDLEQGLDVVYNNENMKGLYKDNNIQLATTSEGKRNALKNGKILRIIRCLGPCFGGIRDIRPNQPTIRKINRFLRTENTTIPFLLISSYQDNFKGLFDLGEHPADTTQNDTTADDNEDKIKKALALLITKQEGGKHDTLIPLSSQIARGASCQELAQLEAPDETAQDRITIKPNGTEMIEAYIYNNKPHATNIIAIDENLFVTHEKIEVIIHAHQVQKDICAYINNIFYPNQQPAL